MNASPPSSLGCMDEEITGLLHLGPGRGRACRLELVPSAFIPLLNIPHQIKASERSEGVFGILGGLGGTSQVTYSNVSSSQGIQRVIGTYRSCQLK